MALLIASALVVAGTLLGGRRLHLRGLAERTLAVSTISLAAIVAILLVAGTLHKLERLPLIALSAIACAAGTLIGGGRPLPRIAPLRFLRRVVAAARDSPFAAGLAVLAAAALLWRVLLAYALPVYAYDALTYHVPVIAEWIRTASLNDSPVNECCIGYPANGELFFTWTGLLAGNDTWVDAVQIGFAALGGVATAGIGRLVGLGRPASVFAGSLFVLTPIVLAQASVPYTDDIVASLLLTSTFFLLGWLATDESMRRRRATLLALAGVAGGIAAGTKLTTVPVVATMVAVVAVTAYGRSAKRRVHASLAWSGVFVVPLVALGGYWYLRDAIDHGNPVYPFSFSIGGHVVFAGAKDIATQISEAPPRIRGDPAPVGVVRSWAQDITFWRNGWVSQGQRLGGLGPLWSYFGALLTVATAGWALRRREVGMLVFLLVVGVSFLAQPYLWWSRFSILLAAAGAISSALAIERLGRRRVGAVLRSGVVALVLIGTAIASWRVPMQSWPLNAREVLSMTLRAPNDRTFGDLFYPPYKWLDDLDDTETIGIDVRFAHLVSPLAGPRFKRRVVRLPTGGYASFDRFAAKEHPDYVIVRRGGVAHRWAKRRHLDKVFEQRKILAYRVRAGKMLNE